MFDSTAVHKLLAIIHDETGGADIDDDVQQLLNMIQFLAAMKPYEVDEYWDALPSVQCISREHVCLIGESSGNPRVIVDAEDLTHKIRDIVTPVDDVISDRHGPYTTYTPMYDLYIVKRQQREKIIPANNVILGQFFYISPPREDGLPRFPAIAQPMITGKHVQIHKQGNSFTVFSSSGRKVDPPDKILSDALLDIWKHDSVNDVVFNAVVDSSSREMYIFDIMLYDTLSKAYRIPFIKRLELIKTLVTDNKVKMMPYVEVKNSNELCNLSNGKWMLKWKNDRINVAAPFWFVYNSVDEPDYEKNFDSLVNIQQDDIPFKFTIGNNTLSISYGDMQIICKMNECPIAFHGSFSGDIVIGPSWWNEGHKVAHIYIGCENPDISGEYTYDSNGDLKRTQLQGNLISIINPPNDANIIEWNPLHIEAMRNSEFLHGLLPLNADELMEEYEKRSEI